MRILSVLVLALLVLISIPTEARSGQQQLSSTTFPGEWPLTVEEGTLFCEAPSRVAFRAPDGTTYAVNGTARQKYPGIDPIWRPNPDLPGTKISLGDLIPMGLALCD
jgi:hypothetical protein